MTLQCYKECGGCMANLFYFTKQEWKWMLDASWKALIYSMLWSSIYWFVVLCGILFHITKGRGEIIDIIAGCVLILYIYVLRYTKLLKRNMRSKNAKRNKK